jgi:hypothetical protein
MLNNSAVAPNNSFNASGDSVLVMMSLPSRLAWIRAAALIRALGGWSPTYREFLRLLFAYFTDLNEAVASIAPCVVLFL